MPLRTSALRALGAFANVFAIESMVDDIARERGEDPVAWRLRHVEDPRARAVIEAVAARAPWAGWQPREGFGRGFGFARYKGNGAYCAVAVEVELTHTVRVTRLVVAGDVGLAVNPDGVANQLEGGAIQAVSWTLKEAVRFDRTRVTSDRWESYPILRFSEVPIVEAIVLQQRDQPSMGAGEAAMGPTAGRDRERHLRCRGRARARPAAHGRAHRRGKLNPGRMQRMRVIDTHTHWYPQDWIDLLQRDGPREGAKLERTDHGYRISVGKLANAFSDEFVSLDLRLAGMQRQGVDVQLMSLTTPMVYWASPALGLALSQAYNDAASAAHLKHPKRLYSFAMVPMQDPALALGRAGARREASRHARPLPRNERRRHRARRQALLGHLREVRGDRLAHLPASRLHHRRGANHALLPAQPARKPVRHRHGGGEPHLRRRARRVPPP
jgi:hypothetical protein